ncbi:MAG: T9SS type A sorting domain-containing protein [Fibrobacteres bacterium]|nr:T9SS type A sorting domain-containing protein [Fibrobacterota bacterium]
MKRFLTVLLVSVISISAQSLSINNPNCRWCYGYSSWINDAVVSVAPKGSYAVCGLYLTFGASDNNYYGRSGDSLEIVLRFNLPDGANITDSWLWVGDNIMKGQLLDIWTANQIYENLVSRNTDPSILKKVGPNSYELKVYPIFAGQTRKVKLTYLVPMKWSKKEVSCPLPYDIVNLSSGRNVPLNVLDMGDSKWKPSVIRYEATTDSIRMKDTSDTYRGNYRIGVCQSNILQNKPSLNYHTPLGNGPFVRITTGLGSVKYYEMVVRPSEHLNMSLKRRIMFLLDYETGKTNFTKIQLLNEVKRAMLNKLSPSDSFNVMVSKLNVSTLFPSWRSADSANIARVIDSIISRDMISNYSNLQGLLGSAATWIAGHGNQGNICLLSASQSLSNTETANALVRDILSLSSHPIQTFIGDYQDKDRSYSWINGNYYYGNSYFYTNLARMTGGTFIEWDNSSLSSIVDRVIGNSIGSAFDWFECAPQFSTGSSYSRYSQPALEKKLMADDVVVQTGRFAGNLPTSIKLTGSIDTNLFNVTIPIDTSKIERGDSTIRASWAGQHINYLEGLPQTNDISSQIMATSLLERVLSKKTAFLCLEPSMQSVCGTCVDESKNISAETVKTDDDSLFTAIPNPFNPVTNISVKQKGLSGKVTVDIYSMQGRKIRTLTANASNNQAVLVWNGCSQTGEKVASGIYLANITLNGKNRQLRLSLMK